MRVRLRIEFDGSTFCGWQLQHDDKEGQDGHLESIQGTLERGLLTVLHEEKTNRIGVQGCGRTDAGVHATEFFCHFDLDTKFGIAGLEALEKLRHSLNCVLPQNLAITHCVEVTDNFHALRDVVSKTYEYRILLRRAKPTIEIGRLWWIPKLCEEPAIHLELLAEGLKILEGQHDFRAFMSAHSDVQSTVRRIFEAKFEVKALGEDLESGTLLKVSFRGDGFLKHQVRNMLGCLMEIAQGDKSLNLLKELLGEGLHKGQPLDRTKAGLCAPSEGLYLRRVEYQKH